MESIWLIGLAYISTGWLAGLLAGLLGIGGGIVVVPVLFFMFQAQGFEADLLIKLATATSLATVIGTGTSSALSHLKLNNVSIVWLKWLAPGLLLGAVTGGFFVDVLPSYVLILVFAVVELLVAARMFWQARVRKSQTNNDACKKQKGVTTAPLQHSGKHSKASVDNEFEREYGIAAKHRLASLMIAGFFIGAISAMAGIGGGLLTVPLLLWGIANNEDQNGLRRAIGTSAACGLLIAIPGVLTDIALGYGEPNLPTYAIGYVVWPAALSIVVGSVFTAPIGAKLAHRLPVSSLKRIFSFVLVFAGLRMLYSLIGPVF